MTSTIKVDNIQNQCGANIINESSNTITIGASGDTVSLASGASQSGFGRAGSVDWQTGSIKTATFTAANGEGYFCNTTSSAFTVNLPSSPSAGNIVAVSDYAQTFSTNNLTIGRGGSNIEGSAADLVLDATGIAMTFVYVDATKGWKVVGAGREADKTAQEFIEATGGTVTTVCSDFKVHTFTGPGTFTVTNAGNSAGSNKVDYMVVAGGGGGSASHPTSSGAGGAGAGGFRESPGTSSGCYSTSPLGTAPAVSLSVSAQGYPITVGGGGAAGVTHDPVPNPATHGVNGSPSTFSSITSTGGGRSGAADGPSAGPGGPSGQPGGSGGGTSNYSGSPGASIGAGNTPPVNPPQGNPGGLNGAAGGTYPTGGGGGATAAGIDASPFPNSCTSKSNGGAGATTSISGSPVAYAGGGGGALYATSAQSSGGTGGGGGGGNAPAPNERPGQAGTTNRGGGGGGGVHGKNGGAGGSGIVIIRYKFK